MIYCIDMLVLCGNVGSCCSFCLTICIASATGTEVKRAFTSKEVMTLEITIKKMADNRNHRRFMLKCIKASVTPVSCKLKNLLKSRKSYAIIHKAEKQILYERLRNINQKFEHVRNK